MSTNFTKIPNYFYEKGLTKNPLLAAFLLWAFSRCCSKSRNVVFNQKEIEIESYEFIYGRESCSEETGITPQQLRTILKDLINQQILTKSTSKSTHKFTVYKWVTERFCKKESTQSTSRILQNQPQSRYILHNKSKDLLFPQPAVAAAPFFQLPSCGKIISITEACSQSFVFGSFLYKKNQSDPPTFPKKELTTSREKPMQSSAVYETEVPKPKRSMKSYFDRKAGQFCEIDKKVIDEWKVNFPHLDLAYEFRKMKDFLIANPKRKGTQTFVTKWLTRSERWRYQAQQNRIAFAADKDKMAINSVIQKIDETDWENDPALQLPDSILRQYAQ